MSFASSVPQRSAKDLQSPVKMPFSVFLSAGILPRCLLVLSLKLSQNVIPRHPRESSADEVIRLMGFCIVRGCGVCDASSQLDRCREMRARGMQSRRNAAVPRNLRSWAKYVCVWACASGRVALLGPSPRRHLASEEPTRAILDCLVPSQNLIIAK